MCQGARSGRDDDNHKRRGWQYNQRPFTATRCKVMLRPREPKARLKVGRVPRLGTPSRGRLPKTNACRFFAPSTAWCTKPWHPENRTKGEIHMLKLTARVVLTTVFAASVVGCSNMHSKKDDG